MSRLVHVSSYICSVFIICCQNKYKKLWQSLKSKVQIGRMLHNKAIFDFQFKNFIYKAFLLRFLLTRRIHIGGIYSYGEYIKL